MTANSVQTSMPALTVFYDGTCPLCVKEMRQLSKRDVEHRLNLVDIYSNDFLNYPDVDPVEASRVLHGIDSQGTLHLGLDVTYLAWKHVGKGWLYAPLRWPGIKIIADWFYIKFANNRYKISALLTGQSRCESGTCGIKK